MPTPLQPGDVINRRYRLIAEVQVEPQRLLYRATDLEFNRPVALFITTDAVEAEVRARWLKASPAWLALTHHNLVPVSAADAFGKQLFTVEPWIEEPTLDLRLDVSAIPLSLKQARSIVVDLARALEHAHSREAIHGALLPEHVIVTSESARLRGFGWGALWGVRYPDAVPPEHAVEAPRSPQTDIYALGILAYRLMTGQYPFAGGERDTPPPARSLNPDISLMQEHVLHRMLAPKPEERYASAQRVRRIFSSLGGGPYTALQQQTPLVGRERHQKALRGYWDQARRGQGQLVFITGEAGIGKTALAQQARHDGAGLRLVGQCQKMEEGTPYQPFIQVLRNYFAQVPPEFLDDDLRELCPYLSWLVPEIQQMVPGLPKPPTMDPQRQQMRLINSLTRFFKAISREQPVNLILEDLHWADASSLDVLRSIGRRLPTMRMLIIGTYRKAPLTHNHPLQDALSDLSRHPTYRHFPMERLQPTEVGALLENLWQQPVPDTLARTIHRHTEGNPFFVEEMVKGLADEGIITLQDGVWQFPEILGEQLPETVRDVVWRRLDTLDDETHALLQQAAVLGKSFQLADLQTMSDRPMALVLILLDLALARQLLHEERNDTFAFRNVEIQQALYTQMGLLQRRERHQRAGEVLEANAQPHPESVAPELAHHFDQAGDLEKSIHYNLAAGHQAQATYANETAVLWYTRTLESLERLSPEEQAPFEAALVDAHRSMGKVLSLVGRYEEARDHFEAAIQLLEADPAQHAAPLAELCSEMAEISHETGAFDEAMTWIERGLSHLDPDEPAPETVKVYITEGWVHIRRGHYAEAREPINKALAFARTLDLRQVEAESLRVLGVTAWHQSHYAEAREHYEASLAIYEALDDLSGQGPAHNNLGILAWRRGDYAQAQAAFTEAIRIYEETGNRGGECASLNNLGLVFWQLGDLERGMECQEQSWRIRWEIGDRQGEGLSFNNVGLIYRDQGNYDKARVHHERALELTREIGDRWGESYSLNNLALLARDLGDYETAGDYHRQALAIWRELGDRARGTNTLWYLGVLAHQRGDLAGALKQLEPGLAAARELDIPHIEGSILTWIGHVKSALGQHEEARTAYRQALDIRQARRQAHLATEPQAGLALVAIEQGDEAAALEHAEAVLDFLSRETPTCVQVPSLVYLGCYRALHKLGDPRAANAAQLGHERLQACLAHIKDEEKQRSFLEKVTANRELREAYERSA